MAFPLLLFKALEWHAAVWHDLRHGSGLSHTVALPLTYKHQPRVFLKGATMRIRHTTKEDDFYDRITLF